MFVKIQAITVLKKAKKTAKTMVIWVPIVVLAELTLLGGFSVVLVGRTLSITTSQKDACVHGTGYLSIVPLQ